MKRFAFVIGLALLIGSGLSVAAKQKTTTSASAQGHTLTLHVSASEIWLGPEAQGFPRAATLTAQVRNAKGQLVDGLEVAFKVEPAWIGSAFVTPAQTLTRNGAASAVLTAETIGLLHVTAQVDELVQQATILVQLRQGPGSSSGGPNIYR
ncbi:MAG: hypothetical protein OEU26_12975 [Candidatus Tectomicrobia bacterium]|nr:hypothetical protein [Candidatus Tectomicrobia bacterium]